MVFLGETKIPEAHILKRWTRDARDVLPPHLTMYQKDTPAMHSKTFRHSLLHVNAMELVKLGDTNLDTFKVLMKHFAAAQKELKVIIDAIGEPGAAEPFPNYESSDAEWHREPAVGYQSEPDIANSGRVQYGLSGSSAGMTVEELASVTAPPIARKVGRPRQNRFLSPLEPKRRKKHSVARPGYVRQSKFCSKCRDPHHTAAACTSNHEAKEHRRKRPKCSSCGLPGHKKNQCFTKTPNIEEYEDSDEDC
jgi:hypothetical protein